MNIALVMEWSTCAKNEIVYETLKKVAESKGHTVVNYGQFNMEDFRQTYNQNAVFTAAFSAKEFFRSPPVPHGRRFTDIRHCRSQCLRHGQCVSTYRDNRFGCGTQCSAGETPRIYFQIDLRNWETV